MLYTITKEYSCIYEVKKSKFYTFLLPYERFHSRLAQLRKEHPKARHFVTAYRYLNEFEQIVEGSSDDGEPKGTAGKPTLKVLQGNNLVAVGVITVRYFGGIKLGTGGLVRAYGDALQCALENVEPVVYEKMRQIELVFGYSDSRKVDYELQKRGLHPLFQKFGQNVCYTLLLAQSDVPQLLSALNGIAHIPHRQEDTKSE